MVRTSAPIYAEEDVIERGGVAFDAEKFDADWPAISEEAESLFRQACAHTEHHEREKTEPSA